MFELIVTRKLGGEKHFHYYLCRQLKGGGMEIIMYIFMAFPFSDHIDKETGRVREDYVCFLSDVREKLIENGHEVFLSHFREEWGKQLMTPEECTKADLIEMYKSDLVIAFPGCPLSGGVHVEMGWASAFGKKVNMFIRKGASYSPLIVGLHTVTDVEYYTYDDYMEGGLVEKIVSTTR